MGVGGGVGGGGGVVIQPKVSRYVPESNNRQKVRQKQIESVYGKQQNQVHVRKSRIHEDREERAKRSREVERKKMLLGIQVK